MGAVVVPTAPIAPIAPIAHLGGPISLTLALAVLGGVVLLAILLHGWWTTRQSGPRKAFVDTATHRVEPSLSAEQSPGQADSEDTLADPRPTLRRVPRIDALIDALVPLALDAPITGDAALAHLPPSHRAGAKPFYVEGLDSETGEWDVLTPGRRYGELQAGVQLANRSGPLNQIEFSEFVQKIEAYAEAIGAAADVPNMMEVVDRARELDGLSAPLDAQLTVTLRSNGVAWSVAYVQQVAARLGFVTGGVPGRLVLPNHGPNAVPNAASHPATDEQAPPLLVLTVDAQAALADTPQNSAVRECVLSLDVPQSPESAEPFPAWHRSATALAADLDASAIDDNGQPVTLHAFAGIGEDLGQLYRQLEALDLAAGTPAARRLFS